MTMVINKNGISVDFEAAVELMDDEIREVLHAEGFETEQKFFTAYETAHEEKYGEDFEVN